jgi:hypothetical protein
LEQNSGEVDDLLGAAVEMALASRLSSLTSQRIGNQLTR